MAGKNVFACVTCDVEMEEPDDINKMQKIAQLLRRHDVKATFFLLVGQGKWRSVLESGLLSCIDEHELGLHIHWAESERNGLKSVSSATLTAELEDDLKSCWKLGFTPTNFRGGGLSQTTDV